MIISKGNIRYIKLGEEDIELVRHWRNSPSVNRYMEYREHITEEMQKKWFRSVHNDRNLYFVIELNGKKVGLINARDIDWGERSAETGVFFWDEGLHNTPHPLIVILIFAELGIRYFNLNTYAHVLRTNQRAIRYNKLLGFELCEGQEEAENQLYFLKKENYVRKAHKLIKAFIVLINRDPLTLLFEDGDYRLGIAQRIEKIMNMDLISDVKDIQEGRLYTFKF